MPDIIAELPRILIKANKTQLEAGGAVPRPQVHMFAEDTDQKYIGSVTCRPFYRGEDTTTAIGDLGILPSVMKMTRLIVLWENRDLTIALLQDESPFPMALMLLDAQLEQHTLHQHPFEAVPTGRVVDGTPTIRLQWGTPTQQEDTPLPQPVHRLLRTWRELRDGDLQTTAIALQHAGYQLNWIEQQ